MTSDPVTPIRHPFRSILALALAAGAGIVSAVAVASGASFPSLSVWAFPGAYQDSSLVVPSRCIGSFQGPLPDSIREAARVVSVRFLRDRVAEKRPDFGGYRIYRMTNQPDSSKAVLIRRFSLNSGSELTWNFSRIDTAAGSFNYRCKGAVANDSIVTFVDPDSNGQYVKICRRPGDFSGKCFSPGDSVVKLLAPPGPHDGFLTWYSVTIEKKNTTDADYEDLFVPDTTGEIGPCTNPADYSTCPNLNHKLRSVAGPVEPTAGPSANLERVLVVPNPYRGGEVWDQPGGGEVHFINLPTRSTIKIYTAAGDLVRVIQHSDPVHDFERWDLKSGANHDVASGIYLYRVESGSFTFQSRFVVIR